MPTSRVITIPIVMSVIRQLNPQSILDVGVGFGKFGYLFREYTDIVASGHAPQRYGKEGWKVRIEGIEGFSPYIHEAHRYIYDKIYEGDAAEILPSLGRYDVVFLGDIIEHFTKEQGQAVLKAAQARANMCVLLITPRFDTAQHDLNANPLEDHHCVWRPADFRKMGKCMIRLADAATYVVAYPAAGAPPFKLTPMKSPSMVSLGAKRVINLIEKRSWRLGKLARSISKLLRIQV